MLFHVNVKVIHNVDMVLEAESMKIAMLDAMDLLDASPDADDPPKVVDLEETVLDYGGFSCEFVSDPEDSVCPDCRQTMKEE